MEEKAREIAEILKVLANENRLLILCALKERPMTVNEIGMKVSSITQSALSQHLSILKAHGILDSKKHGLNITYFFSDDKIMKLMNVLKDFYCNE